MRRRIENERRNIRIISGGARGADTLAEKIAKKYAGEIRIYYPDWDRYGKSAGYIRNQLIAIDAHILIACRNGKSKGTRHTIELMKKKRRPIYTLKYHEEGGTA